MNGPLKFGVGLRRPPLPQSIGITGHDTRRPALQTTSCSTSLCNFFKSFATYFLTLKLQRYGLTRFYVTTSDILVPMALGLGLGILHAQITAYDPQRLKRKQPPPSPGKSTEPPGPEPPQSLTPVPQPQANFSNLAESSLQSEAAPAESPAKGDSTSNHFSLESDIQPSSQQVFEASENGSAVKEPPVSEASKDNETSNSITGRTLSPKPDSTKGDIVLSVGLGNRFQFPPSPQPKSSPVGDPESEVGMAEVCHYSRKRSASLSPDFPLPLPIVPLEAKIKHFKEAKLRGVTDPEVLANFKQQLSPKVLKSHSNWEEGVEEGDEESGGEEPEILGWF
ncbi:hypothetical protein Aperf_G00000062272 [Anoplocephala perfoliata]